MSDKEKKERARGRRPSYLNGPVGSAKNPVPSETVEAKKDEVPPPQEAVVEDKELLSWKVWLMPRRPAVSVAVVVTLLACIGVSYWAFPNVLFIAIITFILFNRLAPYLFPVKYTLTEQGVGYKTLMARDTRTWGKVFTYYEFPDGVLLSNDTRSVRGRLREGLFLYYETGGANKDQVLDVVKSKLKAPTEAMAPKQDGAEYKGGVGSALRRVRKIRGKE
jgi:hypothetical protein